MTRNLPARRSWSLSAAASPGLADPSLYDGVLIRRVFGYLFDLVALAVLAVVLWVTLGILGILSLGLLLPLQAVALSCLPVAYHTLFIGATGATPGMWLTGLQVRSFDGRAPDYLQAFIMTVVFYVSVSATAWLVLLVPLFNERRRTLHDFLSGTFVIRRLARPSAASGGEVARR
jgi:uncharacterized RDD family membrane protein YckC